MVWSNTPFIGIGKEPVSGPVDTGRFRNPIKRALYYQQLLDEGKVESLAELAELAGVVRPPGMKFSLFIFDKDMASPVRDVFHDKRLKHASTNMIGGQAFLIPAGKDCGLIVSTVFLNVIGAGTLTVEVDC